MAGKCGGAQRLGWGETGSSEVAELCHDCACLPSSPAGDFALVRITTFLSRFSRQGLHLRRAMLTLYIFDKAYVGPFARVWPGLAATDSQSFFILLYLHCFCQTKVFQICFLFTLVTMSQMTSLIYAYYDIIYIIICIPYRKLQQKEYYDYET